MRPAPLARNFREKLGFRVVFLMALVLLPLTLVSVIKSAAVFQEAQARSEAALMGETMRAANGELRLIQEARGTATGLANSIWQLTQDPAACIKLLQNLLLEDPQYSLIAYVPEDGISTCNTAGRPFDFASDPLYLRGSRELRSSFAVKMVGHVSGSSVLAISHPVFDPSGTYRGLISLSLPHSGLRVAEDAGASAPTPLTRITYDSTGTILTSSRELDDVGIAIPGDRSLSSLTGDRAFSFSAHSVSGAPRVFSVVPLVPDELYALGSWPPEGESETSGFFGTLPVMFPILMAIASLIVAWLAVEYLVIRHIRKLRHSLVTFSGDKRIVGDIAVVGAPLEIREMAEAYARMTDTLLHDEAELEDMVHQKEVLLREVHHRVKNNLQLIASIMNMQMRRTRSDEARRIMKGLQDRVMSLATIHRELYQTAGLSDVHSDELLSTIVRQITAMAESPDRRLRVHTDFADIRMVPDQAVPLALLLSEAVTNALKYASSDNGQPVELWLTLSREDSTHAELRVRNSLSLTPAAIDGNANEELSEGTGLGTQLIAAFAMQLGGTPESTSEPGIYDLAVRFTLRPLSDAEERHAATATEPAEPIQFSES